MIEDLAHQLENHTPMMQQYLRLKSGYPNSLVLYRMGDFYELFFEDAKIAAEILGITLTRRGNDKQGNVIPMAGVPFHSADGYIARLINAGQTVVVCEQVEEDKSNQKNPSPLDKADKSNTKSNAPKIMERKVVRTLTAGTLTDDNLITQGQTPTVVAISLAKSALSLGIAQLNLSEGSIRVSEITTDSLDQLRQELTTTLSRLEPSEVLVDEHLNESWLYFIQDILSSPTKSIPLINQPHSHFLTNNAVEHLTQHFQVKTLAGFGIDSQSQVVSAASAVLHYGKQTQQTSLAYIQQLIFEQHKDYLQLDAISQHNLEIFKPVLASGISLLSVIDHCQTPMGKRTLIHHLHRPLLNTSLINRRLDAVEQLMALPTEAFTTFISTLATIADIERISGRIGLHTAKPTDLSKLRASLEQALNLSNQLHQHFDELVKITTLASNTPLLTMLAKQLPDVKKDDIFANIHHLLATAIVDEPPAHIRDGGMIRMGFDAQLDHLYHLHDNVEQTLEQLANQERKKNNIPTLKVGFNKVSGFYFELSALQAKNAPAHFSRRQTLKNAERFITPELKAIEESYLSAQGQAITLEKELYDNVLTQLAQHLASLQQLAKAIAYLDVLTNWVTLTRLDAGRQQPWCRPSFSKQSQAYINIKSGRHLVVEAGQYRQATQQASLISSQHLEPFISNDCLVGTPQQPEKLMLITGPNMGGKSTYMRQTALIVLLACCGAYVPAQSADIGRIERIFTRIGSADDLASGKSTFMVEMIETANIMNQANANSLVLMDEVGRGTSTQDGLAIAHACVNYLADNIGCLTLFATHYFELTELAENHPKMFNQHLVTQEIDGQLLLLHKIAKGATHRSFGLHVAKMAGVPQMLLEQAQIYLDNQQADKKIESVENTQTSSHAITNTLKAGINNTSQLGLDLNNPKAVYDVSAPNSIPYHEFAKVGEQVQAINPDELTPKQALEFIYSLKELLNHE